MLSATDAVAATLLRDVGAPRRVVTLLESESLFNHATALVAYLAALGVASFSATAPSPAYGGVEELLERLSSHPREFDPAGGQAKLGVATGRGGARLIAAGWTGPIN